MLCEPLWEIYQHDDEFVTVVKLRCLQAQAWRTAAQLLNPGGDCVEIVARGWHGPPREYKGLDTTSRAEGGVEGGRGARTGR